MKLNLVLIFMLCYTIVFTQKEDYNWFIDINQDGMAPVQGLLFDWNLKNSDPIPVDLPYGIDNNNASICDKDGNLLFWSNGCAVINKDQEVMPNGDTLNWDAFREIIGWKECLTGYPGTQNIKIIPDPGNNYGFYIFHKAWKYNGQGENVTFELRVSYVDMNLEDGKGDVIYHDSILLEGPVPNASLEVIYAENGVDWWLLQPIEDTELMLTYLIDSGGIHRKEDQFADLYFERNRSGGGTMRFSPNGTKLAFYDYLQNLHVYDFDRTTGKISNHQKVIIFEDAEAKRNNKYRFGSIEWSSNSRFMYVAVSDSLFQVDSWENDMNNGIRLIDVYDGTLNPFSTTFYIASLAPDCKIYICSTNGNKSYHIIHQPNELGKACKFVQNGLKLPHSAKSANLPLFPRFRVDEDEKCDSTITSVFGNAVYFRRNLTAYPNPSEGKYKVAIPDDFEGGRLTILNIQAQQVKEQEIQPKTISIDIDITSYPKGYYHIELFPTKNKQRIFWSTQVFKL